MQWHVCSRHSKHSSLTTCDFITASVTIFFYNPGLGGIPFSSLLAPVFKAWRITWEVSLLSFGPGHFLTCWQLWLISAFAKWKGRDWGVRNGHISSLGFETQCRISSHVFLEIFLILFWPNSGSQWQNVSLFWGFVLGVRSTGQGTLNRGCICI
jgi:hypothetical protein